VADSERVSRKTIEDKARAYLERSRSLHTSGANGSFMVKGKDFEVIVQKEVNHTLRELRRMGKRVVD
jgi:hypothetical protein